MGGNQPRTLNTATANTAQSETKPEEIPVPQVNVKNNAGIKEKRSLTVKPQRQPRRTTTHRAAEQEEQGEHEVPKQPTQKQEGAQKAEDSWKDTLHKKREEHLTRYKNLFSKAY